MLLDITRTPSVDVVWTTSLDAIWTTSFDIEFSTTMTVVSAGPSRDVFDASSAGAESTTASWGTEELAVSTLDDDAVASTTESATNANCSGSDFDGKMLELSSCVIL